MNIEIDTNLVPTLSKLAAANNTTAEDYAQGVLESHLNNQFRQQTVARIEKQDAEVLTAVNLAIDEIVPADPTPEEPVVS